MSAFTKDTFSVSESFKKALEQVAEHKVDNSNILNVPGYGNFTRQIAGHEAVTSAKQAEQHVQKGNYGGAAYHHKRAAMFFEAMHKHDTQHERVPRPQIPEPGNFLSKNEEILHESRKEQAAKTSSQYIKVQRSANMAKVVRDHAAAVKNTKANLIKGAAKGQVRVMPRGKPFSESSEESRVARSLARQRKQKDKSKNKKDDD